MLSVKSFFHKDTNTFSYVAFDSKSKDAIVIDPVLDFVPFNATISLTSLNEIAEFIINNQLKLALVLDSHVHADHMTGAYYLKKRFKVPSAIVKGFFTTQKYFEKIYGIDPIHYEAAYDLYLSHEQSLNLGSLCLKIFFTPGHTPACASYLIEDSLFCGDVLLQPELGCGRSDFPGGSAKSLYQSVTTCIYSLPDQTKLFIGHDYPKINSMPKCQTTVFESKKNNIFLNEKISEQEFILKREIKDKTLSLPRLYTHVMQVNILGGQLPFNNSISKASLTIPLNLNFV
jgi:glyoxylase-like metal-dependent hydrolase (beta-lactamase superfamily II)